MLLCNSREELGTLEEFMETEFYWGEEEMAIDQITCFEKNCTFFVMNFSFEMRFQVGLQLTA